MPERTFGAALGELIYQKRKAAGLTQIQLAEDAFGTSGKTRRISELESGSIANPHPKTIDPIIHVLKISDTELEECARDAGSQPDADLDRAYREARNLIDAVARQFEHSNPGASLADLDEFLRAKAKEWLDFRKKIEALDGDENNLSNLKREAELALAEGDFDQVDHLLAQAEELQQDARTLVQIRKQAKLRILRGDNSFMRGDFDGALSFYLGAVEFFRPFDEFEMIEVIDDLAGRVYETERRSLEPSFKVASRLLERALTTAAAQETADQRAKINYKLSLVYRSASEVAPDAQRAEILDKAIAAARRALFDALTCARLYEIASARIILGNCLYDRLKRTSDLASGQEASELFRHAIQELEDEPATAKDQQYMVLLAHAYNSLGNILLQSQSERHTLEQISEALDVYARAIEKSEASDASDAWAAAKINRGNVLMMKAAQNGMAAHARQFLVIQAISSYSAAIEIYPEILFPVLFAEAHVYLASALFEFTRMLDSSSAEIYLLRAVSSYEIAMSILTEEKFPDRFVEIQIRLATIFFVHSEVSAEFAKSDLARAADHYKKALSLLTIQKNGDRLAACKSALAIVKERLAKLNSGKNRG